MSRKAKFLKFVRQLHLYFGTFIAPAVLFFAVTGALQTFSLHEASKDGLYKPSKWIVELSQIHKKQIIQMPAPKQVPADGGRNGEHHKADRPAENSQMPVQPVHNPLPLKIFFLLVSIGLIYSTLSGLYMSIMYTRSRWVLGGLFLAGILIPLALLFI